MDDDLVVDVRDDIDVSGAAAGQTSMCIFGRDPEQGKPAVPDPEIQSDRIQQECRNRAASGIGLVRPVTLLVRRAEPIGRTGSVVFNDASAPHIYPLSLRDALP